MGMKSVSKCEKKARLRALLTHVRRTFIRTKEALCTGTVCLEWYELIFFSTGATCPTQISIESLCQGECIHGVYGAITNLVCNS